jgi:hypothetical protein
MFKGACCWIHSTPCLHISFKSHFIISLSCNLRSLKWSLVFRLSKQNFVAYAFLLFPMHAMCPQYLTAVPLNLIILMFGRQDKNVKLFILLSFGDFCYPFPLSPNVLPCTLILIYPPSLLYLGECSRKYRTASKLMVLYSLTLWCWMLCICNTQYDAQNAVCHIKYLLLCSQLMLGTFKFQSCVFHYWNLIMVPKG